MGEEERELNLLLETFMSAYGSITREIALTPALNARSYPLPNQSNLTLFPLRRESAPAGLAEYLCSVFNQVVAEGKVNLFFDQFSNR